MSQQRTPLEATRVYHIWTHANGDDNLFREERNYTYFLEKYSYHIEPVAETFAYCLMPNHLHVMVRVKGEEEVLEFLRVKKSNPTLQGFQTQTHRHRQLFRNLNRIHSQQPRSSWICLSAQTVAAQLVACLFAEKNDQAKT